MSDIFGKIVTILLAAFCMCILPLLYYSERQNNLLQMYLLTETSYLVDSICNTGTLTESMYGDYQRKLQDLPGLFEVDLYHKTEGVYWTEEGYARREEYYYTKDIMEKMAEAGSYPFREGDYVKLVVRGTKGQFGKSLLVYLLGSEAAGEEVLAYYGGSVKYEIH